MLHPTLLQHQLVLEKRKKGFGDNFAAATNPGEVGTVAANNRDLPPTRPAVNVSLPPGVHWLDAGTGWIY